MKSSEASAAAPLVEMDESLLTESDAEVWRSGGNRGGGRHVRPGHAHWISARRYLPGVPIAGRGQDGAAGPTFDVGIAVGAAVEHVVEHCINCIEL